MALASLGFDPGPADGLFGPRTREVIGEWQRGKGYEKTGYLTKKQVETLVTLGEEAEHVAGERRREETQPKQRERLPDIAFPIDWDDARYRYAQKRNTKEAYRGYLTEYPNGRHADEARRRLKGLSVVVGRRFRDCPECPELVVVAAGTYEMGSPLGEEGRRDNEGPVHRVEIGEPFAVGVYEVTVGEFGQFVEETRHSAEGCGIWGDTWKKIPGWSWRRPGFDQSERHPAACVNWEDAQAFARWLSRKTGKGYRLLSESEWEYVARGGTRTPWYWGGSEVDQCRHGNGADETLERGFGEAFTMSRESADALKKTLASWSLASCDDGHVHASPGGNVQDERIRVVRRNRERMGVGGGLLAQRLQRSALGRECVDNRRGLLLAGDSRRLVGRRTTDGCAFRVPRLGSPRRGPRLQSRFSSCQNIGLNPEFLPLEIGKTLPPIYVIDGISVR